jgi:ElaB/YqjD/DUF883 family membrane-anchored ribosome-binding protein
MLACPERFNILAFYAAPFYNVNSSGPEDGMERSFEEIKKLLTLSGNEGFIPVTYRGSTAYLPNEQTPIDSPAARDLVRLANEHTEENPLYVVAIGAITNVASALLLNPKVAENAVLVWLGGHGFHFHDTKEFNMVQDIAASRVVMSSGIPFVQLPCMGVVSSFTVSKPELEYWLKGKNPLADYLATNTIDEAESYAHGKPWTRVIWDVTAVAWLLNDNNRFMLSSIVKTPLSSYEGIYEDYAEGEDMRYVYYIHRDRLMEDLFAKILHE